jgi:uncharacterized protein YrzB (UPF0473 family)
MYPKRIQRVLNPQHEDIAAEEERERMVYEEVLNGEKGEDGFLAGFNRAVDEEWEKFEESSETLDDDWDEELEI